MTLATSPTTPLESAVLVRVPVGDRAWPTVLPIVPVGTTVTVTVGHEHLVPVDDDDLAARGYRIVGIARARRPIGMCVDLLIPEALRRGEAAWFDRLVRRADRVFDLRLGPVQRVLAAELEMHRRVLSP